MPNPSDASLETCAATNGDAASGVFDAAFVAACADGGWPMGSDVANCVTAGNAITAATDARAHDIGATWNPPDTYTGGQIRSVVASVYSMLDQAALALNQTAQKSGIASESLLQINSELKIVADHRAQADLYVQAAQQADSSGQPVAAPRFKQWILNAINESSNAMVVASVEACIMPWWASLLSGFLFAVDAVWGLIKTVVGIAVKVGGAVVNAVEGAATTLAFTARLFAFVASYWPLLLIVIVGGGYAYYRKKNFGRVFPDGFMKKHSHGILADAVGFPRAPR
jgi:hypothetical protein